MHKNSPCTLHQSAEEGEEYAASDLHRMSNNHGKAKMGAASPYPAFVVQLRSRLPRSELRSILAFSLKGHTHGK